MPYTQWTELPDHQGFTPAGKTTRRIAPGYYDLASDDGRVFFIPMHARRDELLQFPDSASTLVIEGIQQFWSKRDRYREFGLTYKRGVLLYGPPGSGKTSTLQIIARRMVELGGVVLNYNGRAFLGAYRALRDIQPQIPVLVLLEDFEELFATTSSKSTLLNLLDGVEELDNIVFLATTNYPEKLEPRVVNRPSRFDQVIRVPHPSTVARRMYLKTLAKDDEIDLDRYTNDTEGFGLAHVKELFIATVVLEQKYELALQRLKDMRDNKLSSFDDDKEAHEATGGYITGMML